MLSTKFRVEKLLLLDISAKEAEKEDRDGWSNLSGHMFLPSISDQINNLKQLKLFSSFMLFRLDVENRKKMLVPKLRKNEFNKLIAIFSKHKYMSIFGRASWFLYGGLDKLGEVAK